MLGFAAGVMIAASMWSLLIPAIEEAEDGHGLDGSPPRGGSVLGIAFLVAMDALLPHLTPELLPRDRPAPKRPAGAGHHLHNIPEGWRWASPSPWPPGDDPTLLTAAMALALGIGIQNFPEGAAISLPLRQAGMSRTKSFLIGRPPGRWSPSPPCSPSWRRGRWSR